MQSTLAQMGFPIPLEVVLLPLLLLLSLVVAVLGTAWIVHKHKPAQRVAHAVALWWVVVVGSFYLIASAELFTLSLFPMRGEQADGRECHTLSCSSRSWGDLVCTSGDRRTAEAWLAGAGYLAAMALLSDSSLLLLQPSSHPFTWLYARAMSVVAFGLLIPMWVASFAIATTLVPWPDLRFNLRAMLASVLAMVVMFGTTMGVVRKAARAHEEAEADACKKTEAWKTKQLQVRLAGEAKAAAALESFAHAADGRDATALDKAQQKLLVSAEQLDLGDVLRHFEATSDDDGKILWLQLLASDHLHMWRPPHQVDLSHVRLVQQIIEDESRSLPIRRGAVQVLLNWGEWELLAEKLPQLTDCRQLGSAIVEFIVARRNPVLGVDRSDRIAPNGGERLVAILPRLTASPSDSVPALVQILEASPAWSKTGHTAAKTLGGLGPAALDALPQLRIAAESFNPDLRTAAKRAIEVIEGTER